MDGFLCAVDVGTTSARAAIFSPSGQMLAKHIQPIALYLMDEGQAEHTSDNIWQSVCAAVRAVLTDIDPDKVVAIGFDATCSLVLRDGEDNPLPLGPDGRDTILWFDHRAKAEAALISATGHDLLQYAGETLSPEMQLPKLLWLKRQRPDLWAQLGAAYDLSDYLTYRATGSNARSICTLTAKWNYLAHETRWSHDFHTTIGLSDLYERANLPEAATPLSAPAGVMTEQAAAELGLPAGCVVAHGMIDAFAGCLGAIGANAHADEGHDLALIAGTSTCVMSMTSAQWKAKGVWGPYHSVLLPDMWVNEGGQSATGALLDFILRTFSPNRSESPENHAMVEKRLKVLLAEKGPQLASEINILPDVNGNRSPLADPAARGVFSGLTLDTTFDGMCKIYWRTAVALAMGLRQIVEHMRANGPAIERLHVTGGHVRSTLLMQLYADATGCPVHVAADGDAVLLGTAIVAATVGGMHVDLASAAMAMQSDTVIYEPDPARRAAYDIDYKVFLAMQEHRDALRALRQTSGD